MSINIKSKNIKNINNKYILFENKRIGFGSNSVVYLGSDLSNMSNPSIAIKKINKTSLSYQHIEMLQNEIEIMTLIKNNPNKNILKCIDIIDSEDTTYIITEHCVSDFSKIIGKPMNEKEALFYFKQLVNAMLYLKEHNIIHRDIKPRNILVYSEHDNTKTLKLADFGFARILNNTGSSSSNPSSTNNFSTTMCGSPMYMAPEMLHENPYTVMVDIWAIGITLFEMVYGWNPFFSCNDIAELRWKSDNIIIPPEPNTNKNLSKQCISFLKSIVAPENTRLNLEQICNHSWYTETDDTDDSESESTSSYSDDDNSNDNSNDNISDSASENTSSYESDDSEYYRIKNKRNNSCNSFERL